MASKTLNTPKDNQTLEEVPNCSLKVCRLCIINESGAEECLMESVRTRWNSPNAENYCSDQSCRKFVGQFQMKQDLNEIGKNDIQHKLPVTTIRSLNRSDRH